MAKQNRTERLAAITVKFQDAMDELTELTEELEESRDNVAGTNLENTERNQALSEHADDLRSACDDFENAIEAIDGLEL